MHVALCDARNGCSMLPYLASNADCHCSDSETESLQIRLPDPSVFFYSEMSLLSSIICSIGAETCFLDSISLDSTACVLFCVLMSVQSLI